MANRALLEKLAKQGDRTELPRQIDHLVIFKDLAKCEAFIQLVLEQGFGFAYGTPSSEPDEFRLLFSKVDKPTEINDVAITLYDAALKYDGEYDGWGCEVVTDGSAD